MPEAVFNNLLLIKLVTRWAVRMASISAL